MTETTLPLFVISRLVRGMTKRGRVI